MPTFDASTVQCHVYAYKEGLLSAVGHDVMLVVERLSVSVEPGRLEATFEAASLKVMHALKGGAPNPGALADKDKQTIEGYVREDILHARRYPKIRFVSSSVSLDDDGEHFEVQGQLELHGRTRALSIRGKTESDKLVARVKLHQPDYGIAPFRAMLGTLRIQAMVDVEMRVPTEAISSFVPARL